MTLQADSAGRLRGRFTIPAGIPAGTKAVEFVGSGGSRGAAEFTGAGTIVSETRRRVTTLTTSWWWAGVDPLAQTFMLGAARHLGGVDLWFTAKGTSDVLVQVRETTVGIPNGVVLAQTRIKPDAILTNGNATRILFDAPVFVEANREYALVVMCNDATTALAVAELGKWDDAGRRWVTAQPYQVGTLLSSSNASTWTPHQDKDMTFRLLACNFTASQRTVALGNVSVTNTSDLMLLANMEVPTSGTAAELVATLPDGSEIRMVDGQPVALQQKVTGNIALSARLAGNANASPVLYPGIQAVVGEVAASATYVSRAIQCGASGRVVVTLEGITPGTSTIVVELQTQAGDWLEVPLASGADVGDGWVERKHVLTGVNSDTVRIRLTLTGTAAQRPRVRRLRAVATD